MAAPPSNVQRLEIGVVEHVSAPITADDHARKIARDLNSRMLVSLGIGIPTPVTNYVGGRPYCLATAV